MQGLTQQWVIGKADTQHGLPPNQTTNFNFVVMTKSPATTNLQPKLVFSRIILEGGKLSDPSQSVQVEK